MQLIKIKQSILEAKYFNLVSKYGIKKNILLVKEELNLLINNIYLIKYQTNKNKNNKMKNK